MPRNSFDTAPSEFAEMTTEDDIWPAGTLKDAMRTARLPFIDQPVRSSAAIPVLVKM